MASWSPRELVERLLREILTSRVYDVARETPLETATGLSSRVGVPVLLKREDLQPVFSFKLRGAYNKIAQLEPDRQSRGVACASAGNHAQGVAYAARALAVAGLKRWMATNEGGERPLVAILSGANMNFDRLRFVAERAELGEAREAVFGVTIPERPGAFRAFCAAVGPRVVTEFNYRFRGGSDAHIFVGVGTSSRADASALQARLEAEGYPVVDLSDDEMAKLHVRHLVGGRPAEVSQERPCRFQFPERPGALLEFLDKLGGRWNISLFHYRNHGADFGRVLAAFEVPDDELPQFDEFLAGLGYAYDLQTKSPAYEMFLG